MQDCLTCRLEQEALNRARGVCWTPIVCRCPACERQVRKYELLSDDAVVSSAFIPMQQTYRQIRKSN